MGLSTTALTTEKSDAERHRRNRGCGEARALAEHLERVFQVLEEGLHLMASSLSPSEPRVKVVYGRNAPDSKVPAGGMDPPIRVGGH